jgi:hypothetical protein
MTNRLIWTWHRIGAGHDAQGIYSTWGWVRPGPDEGYVRKGPVFLTNYVKASYCFSVCVYV